MMPQRSGKTKQTKTIPAGRRMRDSPKSSETIIVPGREYVQDVDAKTTFELTLFSVNPRNALLFPRLSAIASRYEKYHFRRLHFDIESQAVTTDPGTVFHYMDPDPYDVAATSKAIVLNHRNSARNKVYENSTLRIDPRDLKGERFCRTLAETSGDLRNYDVGAYRVGGLSSAQKIVGELYVDYEVELISPTTGSYDTLDSPEDTYVSTDVGGNPNASLNLALGFDKLSAGSDYLVPLPEVEAGPGSLSVQGVAEFLVELYAVGTGITTLPNLESDSPAGEKKTITTSLSLLESTTKLFKSWLCLFNNPSDVISILKFTSLVATTITNVIVYVRPYAFSSSPPSVLGFSLRPDKIQAAIQRKRSLPTPHLGPQTCGRLLPATAVESVALVAKSHGGTCVMLPDLNSPKVSVPTPSPPKKYVFACTVCDSFDPCCCKSLRAKVPYDCDNCRLPNCLGQCS